MYNNENCLKQIIFDSIYMLTQMGAWLVVLIYSLQLKERDKLNGKESNSK